MVPPSRLSVLLRLRLTYPMANRKAVARYSVAVLPCQAPEFEIHMLQDTALAGTPSAPIPSTRIPAAVASGPIHYRRPPPPAAETEPCSH